MTEVEREGENGGRRRSVRWSREGVVWRTLRRNDSWPRQEGV